VHVHRFEARPVEGRRHLHVAVHPLLAQDGDPRAGAGEVGGRGCGGVEGERDREPRVVRVEQAVVFLPGAVRVVAQGLHPTGRLRPGPVQVDPREVEQGLATPAHDHPPVGRRRSDAVHVAAEPGALEGAEHRLTVRAPDLQHGAQLLAEQGLQRPARERGQVHLDSGVAREGHLAERRPEPAVRAVVVGEQEPFGVQALDGCEEALQVPGVVEVGHPVAQLAVDLGERRGPEAVPAAAQVHEQQVGLPPVGP